MSDRLRKMFASGIVAVSALGCFCTASAETAVIRTSYENTVFPSITNSVALTNGVATNVMGVAANVGGLALYSGNTNGYFSTNNVCRIVESQLGAPCGAVVANYGLGDELSPPPGAVADQEPILDMNADHVVWLDYANKLLAVDSGAVVVKWVMDDGSTNTVTYAVSPNPRQRPVRLYWTDDADGRALQNAGPTIQFGSNYRVDLYESTSVSINEANYQWSYDADSPPPNDVWLDGNLLHAKEGVEGKFLLTYSRIDELGFRQYLGHEVVEVLSPMSEQQSVHVGDRLSPVKRKYEIKDLFSTVSRGASDPTGENPDDVFVYKHNAGEKTGWIWAIRETDAAWQVEIYWKAKEQLDVIWPFEVDIYEISWGNNLQQYIRGDLADGEFDPIIYVPSELSVEVMPYQTRSGESGASDAFAFVEDGELYTDQLGKFLLRYGTEDTVWFEPVEAVSHSGILSGPVPQVIASELQPQDASGAYTNWPGYCYTPAGTAYNTNYYNYPDVYQDPEDIVSDIYAVNRGMLEVWWANASKYWTLEGTEPEEVKLPKPLYFPSLANVYSNVWPADADEIVIASGLGSGGLTPTTNVTEVLATSFGGDYSVTSQTDLGNFADGTDFTLEAWINPVAATNYMASVFDKGDGSWQLRVGQSSDYIGLVSGGYVGGWTRIESNAWTHVALVRKTDRTLTLYINGSRARSVRSDAMKNGFDVSGDFKVGGFNGLLDEVRIWDVARTPEELQDNMRLPLDGDEAGLLYYASFNANEAVVDYNPLNRAEGGRPGVRGGLSLAGASPKIYVQNDETEHGYNPNEEHALIIQDTVYALRSDLNQTNTSQYTSDPFVLVEYEDSDGDPDMAIYKVVAENDLYSFEQFLDAAQMLQAPAPLNQMQPAWCLGNGFAAGGLQPLEDRNGRFWAHQAGDDGSYTRILAQFFYPNQSGFWYPDGERHDDGEEIPLSADGGSMPVTWEYRVSWPEDVPGLNIGATLTNPRDGLPAIRGQLSVAVAYQQSVATNDLPSVKLIDPTRARKSTLAEVPGALKNYRDPKTGYTFFSELPPALRARMFWDGTAAEGERLQLIGEYVERTDGHNYLLLNTLTGKNRENVLDPDIVSGATDDSWMAGVDGLPESVFVMQDDETAADSLALSTIGTGSGYVTLIFNDSSNEEIVDPSEVISMSVIRVETNLYQGRLDTLLSPNPLDKQLTLKYTADFAGQPENFEFEWNYADPDNGSAPEEDSGNWLYYAQSNGLHYTAVGDEGVFGLSDHYLRCRYRALEPEVQSVVGTNWSSWTPPQLAEGWIKRAMKEINPFEQRIRDYMNYNLDTSLSMIQQAGRPYRGDVPLNYDALDDYGLIPIYETIYRNSLDLCANSDVSGSLSLALMMVSGRLADFYTMLGNEAYADALNPTITLGTDDPVALTEIASIHCFQNQMPDLLSEELALLRGRDNSMNPAVTEYPIYNRLAWNFTADIVGGEVAYALNYGISDLKGNQDGSVDEQDAAILFPQGHGDAWGHYLTAVKYYYSMMHQSNFHWYPQVEGILVSDTEVTVSFLHEKKFAVAVAAKARTGLDILNKTWRQAYDAGEELQEDILFDSDSDRAWGVAEWAGRTGQAAYFDWLAANSLLPDRDSDPTHEGIRVIDRVTVPELDEIADSGRRVQQMLDQIDSGLNPLGLAENVVPFDISASGIDAGETHFEQIFNRARLSMQNAASIFDRVQICAQALRDQNEAREFDQTLADEEAELTRRLIEIYGYPYADDIGPGKLYPQGYIGPDLVNYNYIEQHINAAGQGTVIQFDYASYSVSNGMENVDTKYVDLPWGKANVTIPFLAIASAFNVNIPALEEETVSCEHYIGPSGLPEKPGSYSGQRRAEGEIQIALSRYVESLNRVLAAKENIVAGADAIEDEIDRIWARRSLNSIQAIYAREAGVALSALEATQSYLSNASEKAALLAEDAMYLAALSGDAAPTSAGMSVDIGAAMRAASVAASYTTMVAKHTALYSIGAVDALMTASKLWIELDAALVDNDLSVQLIDKENRWKMIDMVREQAAAHDAVNEALQAAETARMEYQKAISAGDALQVERERLRINHAADLNVKRYRNMAYQIFRNDELQRYTEAFDQTARYCYLAAKAYDYETGLLASDSEQVAGSDFMEQIVKARTIGRMTRSGGNSPDMPLLGGPAGDPGLADTLARMQANWEVLDGRLSFNNPQTETGQFSLRSELFRIKPSDVGGEDSDENWRETLESYRVDNLLELPEFKRYCLPFTPADAEEPALVIPFSTDISFGNNFFGLSLAGGDNAYDSTHFATKIRSVGVWFSNFDNAFNGGLANQPRVYLIPVGVDRMRVPSAELDETRSFQVVDQALPVPYPFSEQDWESSDWSALKDMLGDELYNIRRYPSLRAYHDSGDFDATEVVNNSRLIGRSVWNTRWLLIIPGGTLLDDGDEGLNRFIHGREVYPDVRDENGVKDIKIFFQTYSYSGN